ncbi:MAG: hypothetical protein U1E76_08950 [Planctomycetota bacterium]
MSIKWLGAACVVVAMGCQQGPAYPAKTLGKEEKPVEDQVNVVVLAPDLLGRVKDIGTQATRLDDGRLKVQSRLQNTAGKDLHLQLQTVFKDDKGFTTEESTPFEHVLLNKGDSLNYEKTSFNDKATRFVVKVQEIKE